MNTTPSQRFPRISTIDAVYGSVERLRDRLDPRPEASASLSPLDAYLLHLVLEFCPGPAFVADLACDSTDGAAGAVCLSNPGVSRVAASSSASPRAPGGRGVVQVLSEAFAEGAGRGSILPIGGGDSPWAEVREMLSPHETPVILMDAADVGRERGPRPAEALDELPGALVLVLNLGKVGDCEAVRVLADACRAGSHRRLRLMSQVAAPLSGSRIAAVARADSPYAEALLSRIGQAFTTNYDFLDLVRDSCMYAVERGVVRDLSKEVEGLRVELDGSLHRLGGEVQSRDREIARLGGEVDRLDRLARDSWGLGQSRGEEAEALRALLEREHRRPVVKAMILQSGRRLLYFGRKNREILAPRASHRERMAKAAMRIQRRLRGKVA